MPLSGIFVEVLSEVRAGPRKADDLVKAGKLDEAGKILDENNRRGGKKVDQLRITSSTGQTSIRPSLL
jgi:hypothetical protein